MAGNPRLYYHRLESGDHVIFTHDLEKSSLTKDFVSVQKLSALLGFELHDLSRVALTPENMVILGHGATYEPGTLLRLDGEAVSYFTFDLEIKYNSQLSNKVKLMAVPKEQANAMQERLMDLGLKIKRTDLRHG